MRARRGLTAIFVRTGTIAAARTAVDHRRFSSAVVEVADDFLPSTVANFKSTGIAGRSTGRDVVIASRDCVWTLYDVHVCVCRTLYCRVYVYFIFIIIILLLSCRDGQFLREKI